MNATTLEALLKEYRTQEAALALDHKRLTAIERDFKAMTDRHYFLRQLISALAAYLNVESPLKAEEVPL